MVEASEQSERLTVPEIISLTPDSLVTDLSKVLDSWNDDEGDDNTQLLCD